MGWGGRELISPDVARTVNVKPHCSDDHDDDQRDAKSSSDARASNQSLAYKNSIEHTGTKTFYPETSSHMVI